MVKNFADNGARTCDLAFLGTSKLTALVSFQELSREDGAQVQLPGGHEGDDSMIWKSFVRAFTKTQFSSFSTMKLIIEL